MSDIVTQLRENRAKTQARGEAIIANADTAGRNSLSPTEDRDFAAVVEELRDIDSRIEEVTEMAERNARLDPIRARFEGRGLGTSSSHTQDPAVQAFRSAVLERNPSPIQVRDNDARMVRQPGLEKRDLLTSAPANFRPVSFYNRIIESMTESSAVLQAGATLLTTNTGEDMRVPRATARSTAAIVAEAAVIGESDPTLDVVTLSAFKYGCLFQVSTEMVQDTTVDLQAYLARQAGEAIGLALGAHLITGTGTGQPQGVATAATVGVTGPVGTATSFGTQATAGQGTDLLNSLYGSLAEPYVGGAASPGFIARNATITAIRNLKTSAGEIVGTNYLASSPAPFYVDPNVAAMAANARSVLAGDWSRYFVRLVNGIRFERSDDFAFNQDLVTFRCLLRADGRLIDPSAIRAFVHSAT